MDGGRRRKQGDLDLSPNSGPQQLGGLQQTSPLSLGGVCTDDGIAILAASQYWAHNDVLRAVHVPGAKKRPAGEGMCQQFHPEF